MSDSLRDRIAAPTWRDVGPCPCGYRPPNIDSIEGWSAWYDHLSEVHGD